MLVNVETKQLWNDVWFPECFRLHIYPRFLQPRLGLGARLRFLYHTRSAFYTLICDFFVHRVTNVLLQTLKTVVPLVVSKQNNCIKITLIYWDFKDDFHYNPITNSHQQNSIKSPWNASARTRVLTPALVFASLLKTRLKLSIKLSIKLTRT